MLEKLLYAFTRTSTKPKIEELLDMKGLSFQQRSFGYLRPTPLNLPTLRSSCVKVADCAVLRELTAGHSRAVRWGSKVKRSCDDLRTTSHKNRNILNHIYHIFICATLKPSIRYSMDLMSHVTSSNVLAPC